LQRYEDDTGYDTEANYFVIPAEAGIHFEVDLIKANGYLLSQV
jgi:hypothetical protein